MKKIFLFFCLTIFIYSCTNVDKSVKRDEIATKKSPSKIDYISVLKSDESTEEEKIDALNELDSDNNTNLESILKQNFDDSNEKYEELLKLSLQINDFNYSNKLKKDVLYICLKNRLYSDFFRLYSNEKLDITNETLEELKNNLNINIDIYIKILEFTLINDLSMLFDKLINYNAKKTTLFFQDKKINWIKNKLQNNFDYLIEVKDILENNFKIYSDIMYSYLEEGKIDEKNIVAEIIVKNTNIEESLISNNIFIQKAAIKKNGIKNSYNFYINNMSLGNFEIYRGLALINSPDGYNKITKAYKMQGNLEILKAIFILNNKDVIPFLKTSLINNHSKELFEFFTWAYETDKQKLISLLEDVFYTLNNKQLKLDTAEFIIKNYSDLVIQFISKLHINDKISDEIKENVYTYLKNIDKNTREKAYRLIEKKTFENVRDTESDIELLIDKILFLKEKKSKFRSELYNSNLDSIIDRYNKLIYQIKKGYSNKISEMKNNLTEEYNDNLIINNKLENYSKKIINQEKQKYLDYNKEYDKLQQELYILKRMDDKNTSKIKDLNSKTKELQNNIKKQKQLFYILINEHNNIFPESNYQVNLDV